MGKERITMDLDEYERLLKIGDDCNNKIYKLEGTIRKFKLERPIVYRYRSNSYGWGYDDRESYTILTDEELANKIHTKEKIAADELEARDKEISERNRTSTHMEVGPTSCIEGFLI